MATNRIENLEPSPIMSDEEVRAAVGAHGWKEGIYTKFNRWPEEEEDGAIKTAHEAIRKDEMERLALLNGEC